MNNYFKNGPRAKYKGNFNDIATDVNSVERTNLHPAMFGVESKDMNQNKLREGLRNVIAKKFNNDISTFAELLECPVEDFHAFLDGTADIDRTRMYDAPV